MKKLGEVLFEAGAKLKQEAGVTHRKFELAKNAWPAIKRNYDRKKEASTCKILKPSQSISGWVSVGIKPVAGR